MDFLMFSLLEVS